MRERVASSVLLPDAVLVLWQYSQLQSCDVYPPTCVQDSWMSASGAQGVEGPTLSMHGLG